MHPFSYPTPRCYSIPLLLDNHPSYLRCTVRLVRTPPSAAHNTPSLVSIQSLKYNVVSAKLPAVLEALTGTTSRRPCRLSVRYVIRNIHDIKHPPRSTIPVVPTPPGSRPELTMECLLIRFSTFRALRPRGLLFFVANPLACPSPAESISPEAAGFPPLARPIHCMSGFREGTLCRRRSSGCGYAK